MLQPVAVGAAATTGATTGTHGGIGSLGVAPGQAGKPQQQQKSLFSGDLDSTLASLADSLSMGPSSAAKLVLPLTMPSGSGI